MREVFFLLASYGVAFSVCDAKILSIPRRWVCRWSVIDSLLSCYFCTGFWVGLGWYVALDWPVLVYDYGIDLLLHGFAAATACYVIETVVGWLESQQTTIMEDPFGLEDLDVGENDGH